MQVRCINGYTPQENGVKERKLKFWERRSVEVEDADNNEKAIIIQMDGNLHAGPQIIPGDPNECNANGKLSKDLIEKFPHLTIINTTELCDKIITRKKSLQAKLKKQHCISLQLAEKFSQ